MAAQLKRVWKRPSLMVFSTKEPTATISSNKQLWDFTGATTLYLTDDNRSAVQFSPQRIENKRRMIDGTMRSYHVADKIEMSTSWSNIPSRSKDASKKYISEYNNPSNTSGFGAGIDIKNWFETNTGDFWVLMAYDTSISLDITDQAELYHVFFNSFDYSVVKRGDFNDLWDVSISLVEV